MGRQTNSGFTAFSDNALLMPEISNPGCGLNPTH